MCGGALFLSDVQKESVVASDVPVVYKDVFMMYQ